MRQQYPQNPEVREIQSLQTKEEGGLGFDSKALEVKYSRNGNIPSKAKVVYSPNDFFKGNVNDDERTANRATLKTDMEYMNRLCVLWKIYKRQE